MNVRMVNAVFEDRHKPDLDPAAITDRFLARVPDYAATASTPSRSASRAGCRVTRGR